MNKYEFSLYKGDGCGTSKRIIEAENYDAACARVGTDLLPPGYIWSIEPISDETVIEDEIVRLNSLLNEYKDAECRALKREAELNGRIELALLMYDHSVGFVKDALLGHDIPAWVLNRAKRTIIEQDCVHNWVCGDNDFVSGCEICTQCHLVRTKPIEE